MSNLKSALFYALFVIAAFSLTGCASYFKKRSCEKTNWYEFGEKVALSGKWLNSNQSLNECRKLEADVDESELDKGFKSGVSQYCTIKNAEYNGRIGGKFSEDICNGPQLNSLVQSYNKGLMFFCSKENALEVGLSGKQYENNCPTNMEKNFLVGYKKGRLVWAKQSLENKTNELSSIEKELPFQKQSVSLSEHEVRILENMKTDMENRKNLAYGNQSQETITMYEIEINRISNDLSNKRFHLESLKTTLKDMEKKQSQLKSEITSLKIELAQLNPL